MSTGSTGSLLPKWQLAILLGAPIALGLGYLYYRNQTTKLCEDASDTGKKKISNSKDKSISLDGDDKMLKEKSEPKPQSELEKAIAFKNDGNSRFKSGKYNEAIEFYNKAIDTCPKTHPLDLSTFYQNRAAAYEQLKKWAAVKEDCTSALELNSRYVKALYRRAKACEHTNDLVSSLDDITATCILEGFQNSNSLEFADRVLKDMGRRDAKEAFSKRQVVYPSANFIKTYFAAYINDPLTKNSNDDADYADDSGLSRAKKGLKDAKYDDIIAACTDEITSPESSEKRKLEARLLRGTFKLLIGLMDEATQDFDYIVDSSDADINMKVNALVKRASLNVQNDQHQKGFEDFEIAEKIDPQNADIFHQRGQVFVLLEKHVEALSDFNTAVALAPEHCPAVVQKCYAEYRFATIVQNQVQIYNAIQATHRAVEKFPNNLECYNILAQILSEQQQFDKADELFEKAINLQPSQASLYVHRGLLHLQWTGDITKSMELLQKAIEVDNKCELAYETLGTIQVQRGALENAIELFETALKLSRSELEMVHIYSLRNAAIAQLNVAKKLGLDLSSLSAVSQVGFA
ncbi:mitochondrial import receptor subunit TOM70 [Contarinia nasturtii]|uniref:mitochondrial import receptor subunit TOM70 n=1 Tax=Contarinia nasturtii TaxID=265458 RepID=UPI0012D43031|nr:mitochondrial import receptor subunit TOM70 [Contarinia nasturtii]